ncbi:YqjF family protein [Nonomuraea helvata]|uniref:YqjF family protein n=1 Tax=Nonomuraea helvata TaxID=37484 RepID=A0ABV5SGU6_9ACTN
MYHRWSDITFIHWRYPPDLVRRLVPGCLTVETYDGAAWVGLTPFRMDGVRLTGTPTLPVLSTFPETNVRTYVRDDRGRSGIWFLSLDAGRLAAALGGRAGYWLPYFWSDMSVRSDGAHTRYRCSRLWPRRGEAWCDADVTAGLPVEREERDGIASFLTARFLLFTRVAGRLAAAPVEHPPWPLRRAELTDLDQSLLQAAGLPAPSGRPLVHASPGVPVRVGMWRW